MGLYTSQLEETNEEDLFNFRYHEQEDLVSKNMDFELDQDCEMVSVGIDFTKTYDMHEESFSQLKQLCHFVWLNPWKHYRILICRIHFNSFDHTF